MPEEEVNPDHARSPVWSLKDRCPRRKGLTCITLLVLVSLSSFLAAPLTHPPVPFRQSATDPLGTLQGTGTPAPLFWTGDGQRLNNTSFETGTLSPWLSFQTNAGPGSAANVTTTHAYSGTYSAWVTSRSTNFTTSYQSLLYDLYRQTVGFSGGVRLRAAVYVTLLTGNSTSDRLEISVGLTTSIGDHLRIHYVIADGSALPRNSTSDAYFKVAGFGMVGQWVMLDRDVTADANALATFASKYAAIDSVSDIRLSALSIAFPVQNRDPHIKYWDNPPQNQWNTTKTVVYDANLNGVYDTGDYVLSPPGGVPPLGTPLSVDPKIKFVDSNNNGIWDTGEPIAYDVNQDGLYDRYTKPGVGITDEPVIYDPIPPNLNPINLGAALENPAARVTSSYFDSVELYSASGNYDWIRNGNFDSGSLSGWAFNSSFTVSGTTFVSSPYSAKGTAINGAIEMAQSIDARPQVDSTTRFKASVNVDTMTGTSSSDFVDVWVGLVDSQGTPASIYYYFKTGDRSIPANQTDLIYHKVPGFGAPPQWLSVDQSLLTETGALTGFTPPFRVEVVVLEASGRGVSSTTTAYFDNLSIPSQYKPGSAPSTYHATNGANATIAYSISNVPPGEFYVNLPAGQSVLNVTTPENTALKTGEYSSQTVAGMLRIDIPASTSFKHSPNGNWLLYVSIRNAVNQFDSLDATTKQQTRRFPIGGRADLVAQLGNQTGSPIPNATLNITLWNPTGTMVMDAWSGATNSQGWFNASGVPLPPNTGVYWLQAATQSVYIGIRTFQLSILNSLTVSLKLSSEQTVEGSTVTIFGTVGPPNQGVNVTISYRQVGTSQWTTLAVVKTDLNGNYTYPWKPAAGDYEVLASVGDNSTFPNSSLKGQLSVTPSGLSVDQLTYLAIILAGIAIAAIVLVLRVKRNKNKPTSTNQMAS